MTTLRLALEWFLNPDHTPFVIAQQLGWLDDAGLTLELVAPDQHEDAATALAEGTVDLAITEPIHLLQDLAEGANVVGFARFVHTNGGVMYLDGKGISRPRDLAGKRLQYPGAPGPGGLAIARTMIAADGGPAEAPVTPVNHGFFHTAALEEDKADAATLAFYNFEVVEARHKGLPAQFFALKDWGVPDFCQLILTAKPATLRDKAEAIDTLLAVMKRGIDFVKQDQAEAKRLWNLATEAKPEDALSSAIFDATVPCFTHDLHLSRTYYAQLETWLRKSGQVSKPLPAWETYWRQV